ncbi:hypothetical protein ACEWY4_007270 [Coilia grayii]|uniref:Interleukin n=1 Tax=Coilia grayii TaxID=363190 RepID=A0ABD1KG67_9TELE
MSSEVWNSFVILSYLSALLARVDASLLLEIKTVIPSKYHDSDAMLYTPSLDIIAKEKGCECFFMQCYLLELKVYHAEQGKHEDLRSTKKLLEMIKDISTTCTQCEAQPIANISTFSTSLREIIQRWESLPTNQVDSCFKLRDL